MPAVAPIKLGSAAVSGWTFQTGSNSTTDQYGIQSCSVNALFGDGSSVYSNIPAEGSSFSTVFGNSYLPSGFLLDFFEGAPQVEFLEGTTAKTTFKFKRIDPLFVNRRTVSVDSVINYQNNALSQVMLFTNGLLQNNIFGFPDPTCSVKYSTTTQPGIGTGGLSSIYALPGSQNASGFPAVPDMQVPFTFKVAAGSVISYWDGTTFQSFTAAVQTTFIFNLNFIANPRGWQLVKLKYDPIAQRNFFAVEEEWRNFYSFQSATFVSHTP